MAITGSGGMVAVIGQRRIQITVLIGKIGIAIDIENPNPIGQRANVGASGRNEGRLEIICRIGFGLGDGHDSLQNNDGIGLLTLQHFQELLIQQLEGVIVEAALIQAKINDDLVIGTAAEQLIQALIGEGLIGKHLVIVAEKIHAHIAEIIRVTRTCIFSKANHSGVADKQSVVKPAVIHTVGKCKVGSRRC